MAKTKFTQRPNKKPKEEPLDDSNQKNNWVVERHDVAKQEFLNLKSKLFKTKGGALDLKDKEFFTFAAISYFFWTHRTTQWTILVMCRAIALEY